MRKRIKTSEENKVFLMKRLKGFAILILFLFTSNAMYAQVAINGKVINKEGESIIGVTITIDNQNRGVISDKDGKFIINIKSEDIPCVLNLSYIGYKDKQVAISSMHDTQNRIITIEESDYLLDDVIVIGYGTSSRKKLTGAVAKVDAKSITQSTQEAPILALQGKASGVYIKQGSGIPGGGNTSVVIRGISTLTSSKDPLYIVDGVPLNASGTSPLGGSTGVFGLPDALAFINPNDIESIEILKDADATAIYGTRGTNGVILVSTKKGKTGKVRVNVAYNTTASMVAKKLDFLGTEDYVNLRSSAYKSDLAKGYVKEKDYTETKYPELLVFDQEKDYNWQEQMMGSTSIGHDLNMSISGGSATTSFIVGGSYYTSNTVLISSDDYSRWSARANLVHKSIDNRLNIEAGVVFSGITMQSNTGGAPYSALNTAPNTPMFNDEGGLYYIPDNSTYTSPINFLARESGNKSENIVGNSSLSYKIWDELTAKVSLGYTHSLTDQFYYLKKDYWNPEAVGVYSEANYNVYASNTTIVEPQLSYKTSSLEKGVLSVLVGGTYQYATNKRHYIWGRDYLSDIFLPNVASSSQLISRSNPFVENKIASLFSKVSYDYDSRYLANLVYRRDGSSRFGIENRFGDFYSVGLAWLFSNEGFVKEQFGDVLSFGKLRASYGLTGHDGIGDYEYLTKYSFISLPYVGQNGLKPDNMPNEDLRWETTKKFDVGLELGLLNDRIFLSTTYFYNKSYDLLTKIPMPSQVGFSSLLSNMDAVVENQGFEIELNTQNIKRKDFSWKTSFNITIPKNTLLSYEDLATSTNSTKYVIGESINVIRGYKFLGIDNQTGIPKFLDVNEDGRLSSRDDYVSLGTTDPKLYGGLSNTLIYKNFTLDINFYFRVKKMEQGYFYNYYYPAGTKNNTTKEIAENSWTTVGEDAKYPGITSATTTPIARSTYSYLRRSDFAYSNGSYLRLQNLSFAYNVPTNVIKKMNISALRLYVQGKNLFTITQYDSYDPETGVSAVPALTSFIFGLNVTF